jgi:hypothetical protein
VALNYMKKFTPGGALPSIPLSFSLATILPPEPEDSRFPAGLPEGSSAATPSDRRSAPFTVETTTVSDRLRSPNSRS